MKHKKIVFVCTGNTCRSPMAEAAFRQMLKKHRIAWYRISSAGLSPAEGSPMSEHARQALTEANIPFDKKFASRKLTLEMIGEASAVVCMTSAQQEALRDFPNVTSFPALCGREIPDPYGQGIDAYRTTLRAIRECLPKIAQTCCPKPEGSPRDEN